MKATTPSALTPKQQQVHDLISKGVSVADIAKRLKISNSGVYGHIRNMKAAGVTGLESAATTAPATPPPPPAAVTSNGAAGDPSDALGAAVRAGQGRIQAIEEEKGALEARIEQLRVEAADVTAKVTKYEAALAALA